MKQILYLLAFSLTLLSGCQNSGSQDVASGKTGDAVSDSGSKSGKKNILFFGNSLTAAYQLSPEQGFTALIQRKIDSLGYAYTCVNAGISGETTTDGVNRINWVLRDPVDIFVLELGANDALRGLDLKTTKKNLETIIQQVKARYPGCRIVVAGMEAPPNLGADYTKYFKDLYWSLSDKYEAVRIPFLLQGVAGIPALNLEDGIHPNVAGQKIVAENVWKVLEPLLKQ